MRVVEKIKAFFKREKAATKVEANPTPGGAERKTNEASGEEGTKG